jgi:hypothetical protein
MNYYFEPAPYLSLNLNLKTELSNLDRSKLTIADAAFYDMDPVRLNNIVGKHYSDEKQCFFDFYGDNFTNMASCTTWYLTEKLEKLLLNEYEYFFNLINEAPEIRLQAIAGTHLPVHIDNARSVSIVHPLKNHLNTWTKFYDHDIDVLRWNEHYSNIKDQSWPDCKNPWEFKFLPDAIKTELLNIPFTHTLLTDSIRQLTQTVLNPGQVTEVCEVKIDKFPFILNVNKCHSVYCPDAPTDENPRLAVFFKWRKASFTQIVDAYTQYVQSKI